MKKIIYITLSLFLFIFLLVTSGGITLWYVWSSNLPYIGALKDYNPPIITEVFSDDGHIIGRFWDEKRILAPLENISENVINAFIAAEDARFLKHSGLDFIGIVRAFLKNLKAGRIQQGGSTITQQVTKSLLLKNPKRTYRRKVREALLSLQIEREFSKDTILQLYLNQIYLGHGLYGVEAASLVYFGKTAYELNIAESALLAGLARAPSRDDPVKHFNRAKLRQNYVLQRMRQEGFITEKEYEVALKTELIMQPYEEQQGIGNAPYFLEFIRKQMIEKYGRHLLYRGGLKIYTTVNMDMVVAAKNAIKRGLKEFDKREGYRGYIKRLCFFEEDDYYMKAIERVKKNPLESGSVVEGIVTKVDSEKKETIVRIGNQYGIIPFSSIKWARLVNPEKAYYEDKLTDPGDIFTPGDIINVKVMDKSNDPEMWILSLAQEPGAQAALFCMETKTGHVKAIVGGSDFSRSQFNRAVQSRRQPGSAFKPIIYAAALDKGMTPSTVIIDTPFISRMSGDEETLWKPKNYKERFFGPTLFRTGLIKSRNILTIKILKKTGTRYVINYARRLGIESPLNPDLSLALGSSGLSLVELTNSYSVFANGGMLIKPIFIRKIVDRHGKVIEENNPSFSESISPETAYIMTDLLKSVVQEGTGWRVRQLGRPAAGKTGTTNDLRDAWFIGFTPDLVCGTWVGYDDRRPMGKGETGSRAASPIWLYFMKEATKRKPITPFQQPEGIVITKIDAKTGLLASPYSKKTVFQAFRNGTEPVAYSPKPDHGKPGQFFEMDMERSH